MHCNICINTFLTLLIHEGDRDEFNDDVLHNSLLCISGKEGIEKNLVSIRMCTYAVFYNTSDQINKPFKLCHQVKINANRLCTYTLCIQLSLTDFAVACTCNCRYSHGA